MKKFTRNDMIDFAESVYNDIADLPGHEPDDKRLDEWIDSKHTQLNEVRATLMVNYSGARPGSPTIIEKSMNTHVMLIAVLEYLHKQAKE